PEVRDCDDKRQPRTDEPCTRKNRDGNQPYRDECGGAFVDVHLHDSGTASGNIDPGTGHNGLLGAGHLKVTENDGITNPVTNESPVTLPTLPPVSLMSSYLPPHVSAAFR